MTPALKEKLVELKRVAEDVRKQLATSVMFYDDESNLVTIGGDQYEIYRLTMRNQSALISALETAVGALEPYVTTPLMEGLAVHSWPAKEALSKIEEIMGRVT